MVQLNINTPTTNPHTKYRLSAVDAAGTSYNVDVKHSHKIFDQSTTIIQEILNNIKNTSQLASINNNKTKVFITADKISIIKSKTKSYTQDGLPKTCTATASSSGSNNSSGLTTALAAADDACYSALTAAIAGSSVNDSDTLS